MTFQITHKAVVRLCLLFCARVACRFSLDDSLLMSDGVLISLEVVMCYLSAVT